VLELVKIRYADYVRLHNCGTGGSSHLLLMQNRVDKHKRYTIHSYLVLSNSE